MNSFKSLKLSDAMLMNLDAMGFQEMMPVQEKSIPIIIEGKDILAQAKTGSGKTAAFGIGLLQRLNFDLFRIQALVLCPTRELAEQVAAELRLLARFRHNIKVLCLTGGRPQNRQEHSLSHEAHIVVGTPGRLIKLLDNKSLDLTHVGALVLDEADRMLDMGFSDQVNSIIAEAPTDCQRLCFSATFSDEIRELSRRVLHDPEEITVESQHKAQDITQIFYTFDEGNKAEVIHNILSHHQPESTLIFCNTKEDCKTLSQKLNNRGLHSLDLQGDMEQRERTETLIRFANASSAILVATDVAARGLDIKDLSLVINAELPFETENYIHRIGRTGRAGKKGLAVSLVGKREINRLNDVNKMQGTSYKTEDPVFSDKIVANLVPAMVTISLNGGRRSKLSAGDILGALTAGGLPGTDVGKIDRLDNLTYVAVKRQTAEKAFDILSTQPVKGKKYKVVFHD